MRKFIPFIARQLLGAALFGVCLVLSVQPVPVFAQVTPGSLVVVDSLGDTFSGALYLVDSNGHRRILSRLQDPSQGPPAFGVRDVAVAPNGFIYIAVATFLLEVHPLTGNRAVITDVENPDQGPTGEGLFAVTVDSNGNIYAADATGLLFLIGADGLRSVASRFDDDTQGRLIALPKRLVLETDTKLLVVADNEIVPVNLVDGTRGEPIALEDSSSPSGLAIEPSGHLLVTTSFDRLLIRIDKDTLEQVVVSDFANLEQGPSGRVLEDVAVNASGEIFVVDSQANASLLRNGGVFKVHPETGDRILLSDFGLETQGPTGFTPNAIDVGVAVTATPEEIRLVRSALLATEKLKIQNDAVIHSGSLIVNNSSGAALIGKGAMVNDLAATPEENFEVAASSLKIKKNAVVRANVFVDNSFKNQGTVLGTETITEFPLVQEAFPPFQEAVPGDTKVVVDKNGILELNEPGRFKSITVKKGGMLILGAEGEERTVYEAETFKASKQAEIIYKGPLELRVSRRAKFGKDSVLRPADEFLDATDAILYIAGKFKTGKRTQIQANIVGPDSDCRFGKLSELIGAAYCRTIKLGKSAEVSLFNFLEDSIVGSE